MTGERQTTPQLDTIIEIAECKTSSPNLRNSLPKEGNSESERKR